MQEGKTFSNWPAYWAESLLLPNKYCVSWAVFVLLPMFFLQQEQYSVYWLQLNFLLLRNNTLWWASLGVQKVKNLSAVQETGVRSPGWDDPLEKGVATHSSILTWRILWTEKPGGLQFMGSHRVVYLSIPYSTPPAHFTSSSSPSNIDVAQYFFYHLPALVYTFLRWFVTFFIPLTSCQQMIP